MYTIRGLKNMYIKQLAYYGGNINEVKYEYGLECGIVWGPPDRKLLLKFFDTFNSKAWRSRANNHDPAYGVICIWNSD